VIAIVFIVVQAVLFFLAGFLLGRHLLARRWQRQINGSLAALATHLSTDQTYIDLNDENVQRGIIYVPISVTDEDDGNMN
jgi:hypothetical protein